MRIERLDLIRYGAFTDRSLVLAPAVCDMQIVFGPNEAGKSTARAALEDLLFGIEERSPYGGFLHVYSALRLAGWFPRTASAWISVGGRGAGTLSRTLQMRPCPAAKPRSRRS